MHEIDHAPAGLPPPMEIALCASFGSVARWREEFIATGLALSPGSGRVMLAFAPGEGRLTHRTTADPGSAPPLLEMHLAADHPGNPARVAESIEAFIADIRWSAVHERYRQAMHDAAAPYALGLDDTSDALLLDVRRAAAFDEASDVIPGAQWRDPARVGEWGRDLVVTRRVVVYCVAGHEVSRAVALRLRACGLDAGFLAGGMAAWQASGRLTSPKSD